MTSTDPPSRSAFYWYVANKFKPDNAKLGDPLDTKWNYKISIALMSNTIRTDLHEKHQNYLEKKSAKSQRKKGPKTSQDKNGRWIIPLIS